MSLKVELSFSEISIPICKLLKKKKKNTCFGCYFIVLWFYLLLLRKRLALNSWAFEKKNNNNSSSLYNVLYSAIFPNFNVREYNPNTNIDVDNIQKQVNCIFSLHNCIHGPHSDCQWYFLFSESQPSSSVLSSDLIKEFF